MINSVSLARFYFHPYFNYENIYVSKKIFLVLSLIVMGSVAAQAVDEKARNHLSGSWSTKCGVAGETYTVIESVDGGSLKLASKNRDVLLSTGKLTGFSQLPSTGSKSNYAEGTLLGTYQLDWDREDHKTKKKDNRRWKIDYLKNSDGIEQYVYLEVTIDGKKTIQDNKTTEGGRTPGIHSKCRPEQTAKMSEGVTQTEAELKDAIEEALDGMEIDYPEMPAVGTPISWKK